MADVEQRVKMAIFAGASKALKIKEQNPRISDTEILKQVGREVPEIMDKLDQDL